MADKYLCPEEQPHYCANKGCLIKMNDCSTTRVTTGKPGYKIDETPSLPLQMIERKIVNAQHLFNNLQDIIAWTKEDEEKQKEDIIRFCATIGDQCVWVKIVAANKEKTPRNEAYECARKEYEFFKLKLLNHTPHIVECAATGITLTGRIEATQNILSNAIISKINILANSLPANTESTLMGVFYVQPKKWVYLETFMNEKPNPIVTETGYIVTESMVVSILFQIVYTIACLNSRKRIHGNLRKPKTIVLDLLPEEKTITYYRNGEKYTVPTSPKVIIMNWENVTQGDKNSDIQDVCNYFKELIGNLSTTIDTTFLNTTLDTTADEFLISQIFHRFLRLN